MKLAGLQKTTLLDFPEKLACTVFTAGCNFRCPYCHNASLVEPGPDTPLLSEEDFFCFLEKRRGILEGVCVSGGEPLLHGDIAVFLRRIRSLGFAVKLDTNGSFPDRLKELVVEELVDYIAMDLKHKPEDYSRAVGLPGYDPAPVLESAAFLIEGHVPYEFRCTTVKELHTAEDFQAMGELVQGALRFFLQRFTDSGDVLMSGFHPMDEETIQKGLSLLAKIVEHTEIR